MGTSAKIPRSALAAVPLLVFLTLLFAQEARAQATITQAVGVTNTVYLTIGGPYGSTDLTAVTGATDLVITDSGAGAELQVGGTVSLALPNTNWEWVPSGCVATTTIVGGSVSFATPVDDQTLVATLAGAPSAAGNSITFTVLTARCVSSVTSAISATAIAATTNTFTSMTDAAWGTTIAAAAGPSLTFSTPTDAGADSTDLADGDGGWDLGVVYALTTHVTGADADMQLWWSVDSSLTSVNDEEGAFRSYRDSTNVEVPLWIDVSTSPTTATPLTNGLSDWDVYATEYYLYATCLETGDRRIGRAGPIRVFHYPTNNLDQDDPNSADATVDFASNDADYLDSGSLLALDDGTQDGSGVDNVTWTLTTIDFDHNADVDFYYSTLGSLTESDLVLSGSSGSYAVTGLTGATLVAPSDTLEEDVDFTFNWDVYTSDTDFVAAGAYYVYVVSNDGFHQDVDVSAFVYNVSHSPVLVLQDPYPDGTTAIFDLRPDVNRYFNINWGLTTAGDNDTDNNATIAFYIDADTDAATADFGQTTISTLTATSTATDDNASNGELIYSTTITENPDHQLNNMLDVDMWSWNEAFRASLNARVVAGDDIILYGVITSGSLSRICTYNSEDTNNLVTVGEDLTDGTSAVLTITNAQDAYVVNPPDLGGAVNWGEAYRIGWEFAWDFGETNQNILIYVGDEDMNTYGAYNGTWSSGGLGLVSICNNLWVANSTDGTVANNTGTDYVITGLSTDGVYDWQPATMTGNSVGFISGLDLATAVTNSADLYVYLVVSSNAAGSAPAATDLVFQAPGPLTLVSDAGNTAFGYKLIPSALTVTQGEDVTFRIYVDSGVPTAEIATVFMSCDTTYWDVKTPSAPFVLNETVFNSALVVENSNDQGNVSNGRHHLNFVYGANGAADANFDGGTNYVATLTLTAKHTGIVNAIDTEIYFDQDPPNDRWTTFIDGNGNEMQVLVQLPAARAESYPRGELQGNVDLQGVDDFAGMVATIAVSPSGAIHGMEEWDTLFAANDADTTTPGLQYVLDQAGHYHLLDVPNGEYDFTVHVDGWLDGTTDVVVQHGDHLGDIDPNYTQRITQGLAQQRLQLLAGDCAGYTDSTGTVTPDNQVDATDLTAVKNAYDATPDSSNWNALCDFERVNSLDHIYIDDLSLVNANQGLNGVPLVYRTTGQSNDGAAFRIVEAPEFAAAGQEFDVTVRLEGAADVRGLDVRLSHPGLELVALGNPEMMGGYSQADYLMKEQGSKVVFASAVKGNQTPSFVGSGDVMVLTLRALEAGRPQLNLCDGTLVNSAFESAGADLDNSAVLPVDYLLGEAYPNPFNPTTSIQFQIPEDGMVKLSVFNMLGQKVRTLVSEPLQAGHHLVTWDSTNDAGIQVASGVYVYQIDVNDFTKAHKMVLLK